MRRSERADREDLPAAALEATLDCVIGIDGDGRVITWNAASERTFGYARDEAVGRTVAELIIPPDFQEAHQRGLRRYLTTGESRVLDRRLTLTAMRRDESTFPCELTIHAVHAGQATYFTAYLRDLTESARHERDLREANEVLERRVLERTRALEEARTRAEVLAALGDALQTPASPVDVSRAALERLAPAVNATAMMIVILENDRIRLPVIWGALPERIAAYIARPGLKLSDAPLLERAVREGEAVYVADYAADAGAIRDFPALAFGAEPIQTPGGSLRGGLVAWRARGAPWQTGEQDLLRRAALTLGLALERAENAERLERQHEDLQAANQALERSNRDLEQFAYVASHDLQEPLRTIASFTELLRRRYEGHLDAKADTYIRTIVRGAERMKVLVDDLLSFSRLTRAHEPLTVLALEAPLADATARLAALVAATGAVITHDPLPVVRGHPGLLSQLFQNLLTNGIKFHRANTAPRLHVAAWWDGAAWVVTVTDNGIGIEEAYFERIFMIFQRLHTRETYEGTGIGLAVCRRIVDLHGGRIWVDSTPGRGSAFHFTLGAADSHPHHDDPSGT